MKTIIHKPIASKFRRSIYPEFGIFGINDPVTGRVIENLQIEETRVPICMGIMYMRRAAYVNESNGTLYYRIVKFVSANGDSVFHAEDAYLRLSRDRGGDYQLAANYTKGEILGYLTLQEIKVHLSLELGNGLLEFTTGSELYEHKA
jgi:hypothetical protein